MISTIDCACCSLLKHGWVPSFFDSVPSVPLLPQCAAYIQLKLLSVSDAGDHEAALCEVVGTGMWDQDTNTVLACDGQTNPLDDTTALYTGFLRSEGIL